MASNQTSNYGLNQWEATDQVLRTDFNQDNAKLDAALKAMADGAAAEAAARTAADQELEGRIGLQSIKSVTLGADGTVLEVDLSDIDWSQWKTVYICLDVQGNGYYCSSYGSAYARNESHSIPGKHCLVLWPMYQAESSVGGLFLGYNVPVIVGPCIPYSQFTVYRAITHEISYNIKKGSKITVFGER